MGAAHAGCTGKKCVTWNPCNTTVYLRHPGLPRKVAAFGLHKVINTHANMSIFAATRPQSFYYQPAYHRL
ncbi:hypothetical protein ACLOJK_011486 [Asimina triloba]